jgi:hypothetical protein
MLCHAGQAIVTQTANVLAICDASSDKRPNKSQVAQAMVWVMSTILIIATTQQGGRVAEG